MHKLHQTQHNGLHQNMRNTGLVAHSSATGTDQASWTGGMSIPSMPTCMPNKMRLVLPERIALIMTHHGFAAGACDSPA